MRCSLFANLTARCIGARCRVISGFFPPTSRHSEARSDSGSLPARSNLPARDRTWNLRSKDLRREKFRSPPFHRGSNLESPEGEKKFRSLASLSSGIEPGIFGRKREKFRSPPFHRGSNLESPNFRTATTPMTHHGETPTRAPSSPTRRTRRSVENVTNEHVRRLKTSRRSMCSSRGPFLFVGPPARLLCRSRPVRPVYAGRW